MQIDIILEPGTPADEILRLGRLAEAAGIQTVWASNFPARRDPFLTMVPLARESQALRLGIMPVSPFEKQPVKIADTLLTFNEMCGGRASLLMGGLGRSGASAMGVEPLRRVTATREAVQIVRAACRQDAVNFSGELYRAQSYSAPWRNPVPPRIYVAANGPQMLRMAAGCADGVMFSDATLAMLPGMLEALDSALASAGRQRSELRLNNFFAWHVKHDRAAAIAEARQELVWRGVLKREYIEFFLDEDDVRLVENAWPAFLQAFIKQTPVIEGVPEHIIEKLIDHLTLTGDESDIERIIAELQEFAAAGLDEIALRMHRDADAAIALIGRYIVPALS